MDERVARWVGGPAGGAHGGGVAPTPVHRLSPLPISHQRALGIDAAAQEFAHVPVPLNLYSCPVCREGFSSLAACTAHLQLTGHVDVEAVRPKNVIALCKRGGYGCPPILPGRTGPGPVLPKPPQWKKRRR